MNEKKVRTFYNERWVQIETTHPTKGSDYFISNYGKIKSVNKETGAENLLKGSLMHRGFIQLNLRLKENKTMMIYIHRFVAQHFLEKEREDQEFIVHKDGNKVNNYWENLKWVSREELTAIWNEKEIYKNTKRRQSHLTKMTESKVRLLRKRIKEGKTKKKILAKSFGISTMQLNRIERGENWGHVE